MFLLDEVVDMILNNSLPHFLKYNPHALDSQWKHIYRYNVSIESVPDEEVHIYND